MTKKQIQEEKFYLNYSSISLFITELSQNRNSNSKGADAEAMDGCC